MALGCSTGGGQRGRRRSAPSAICRSRRSVRWRWRKGGSVLLIQVLLLFLQEVDNELLVFPDEVVRKTLILKILAKVLAPQRVKGVQHRKLGGWLAIDAARGVDDVVLNRVGHLVSGRFRGRRGRCRRVSVAEETSQNAMLVSRLGAAAKRSPSSGAGCVLLSFVHLLLELLGLLLVNKA